MALSNILNILTFPLFSLLSLISIIFPKDKRLWAFGAWDGQRYSDNSRYLFEHVCGNEPDIRAVWLTRNKKILKEVKNGGKEGYHVRSLKGSWIALRAGIVFVTSGMIDVSPLLCYGALKVQLWHGTPLKKIGLDDRITGNREIPFLLDFIRAFWRRVLFYSYPGYDVIISPSPRVRDIFSSAFGVEKDRVIMTGYPRDDIILKTKPLRVQKLEELRERWGVEKTVLYAPTFRKGADGGSLFAGLDTEKLNRLLILKKAMFIVKMHYVHRDREAISNSEIESYRMHLLTEEEAPDINILLPYVDVLITDYSSVYFDFLLLNKPIIFTPFDIEKYTNSDREFYEDYDAATPGPRCKNWDTVINVLEDIFSGADNYMDLRREKLEIFNTFKDMRNCERIVKNINSILFLR